jgi:hypothetical protein
MRSVYLGVCGDISFVTVSVTLLAHTVSCSLPGQIDLVGYASPAWVILEGDGEICGGLA